MSKFDLSFRLATGDDMKHIQRWLEEQNSRQVHGSFWCNWKATQNVYKDGGILVCVDENTNFPIAYMWSNFGIIEVKEDCRGLGIGKLLVEFAIEKARFNNEYVVDIECEPSSSVPFWKKMGFHFYSDVQAYRLLERSFRLPENGELIEIEVSFYHQSRKWNAEERALAVFKPEAVLADNGTIYLGTRVGEFCYRDKWGEDPVVGITLKGKTIFMDKAKYLTDGSRGINCVGFAIYMDEVPYISCSK